MRTLSKCPPQSLNTRKTKEYCKNFKKLLISVFKHCILFHVPIKGILRIKISQSDSWMLTSSYLTPGNRCKNKLRSKRLRHARARCHERVCWEILTELVYYKISEGGTSWLNKKFVFV